MEDVIRSDGRYPLEAYAFLHDGLTTAVRKIYGSGPAEGVQEHEAVRKIYGPGPGEGVQRHVSGQDLCGSLRDLALERWGMLARTVLRKWNIRETIDFGNMVYLLVEHDFMKKTDEDSLEDFRDVFDFDEAFAHGGEFELKE